MIIAGYEFKGVKPFNSVYFTGIVRDKQRRKMSKSLGNSPDALKLISEYGAYSVRVALMLSSSAGNDLLFDESLCSQGRSFANKIWNAYRLIDGWEIKNFDQPESSVVAVEWYENKFQLVLDQINDHFDKFRISDSLMSVYKLVWDDFCSEKNLRDLVDKNPEKFSPNVLFKIIHLEDVWPNPLGQLYLNRIKPFLVYPFLIILDNIKEVQHFLKHS